MAVIIDTGVIYALADASDGYHDAAVEFLKTTNELLIVPVTVLPEACYLVNKYLGADVEIKLVRSIAEGEMRLENLTRADLVRAIEVLSQYADANVGFVDASIVAIAERLGIKKVLTVDHQHFYMFRPRHCAAFEISP